MGERVLEFQDLEAWKSAHALVLNIYKATETFPDNEKFGLVSQMRRAAVSITSNIAEGFGRRGTRDKMHFYVMSRGSLSELLNQLLIARDVGYMPEEHWRDCLTHAETAHRLLNALIASMQRRS